MTRREPDGIRHDGGTVETASPAPGASRPQSTPFDVFLSYNRRDSGPAEHIANSLRSAGLTVFFDRWTLQPGGNWTSAIEKALHQAPAVLVLIGPSGMGDWQRAESDLALDRQRRDENVRVVPVLLRGADPPLGFLRLNTWVDLSAGYEDRTLLDHLVAIVRGTDDGRAPALCPYRGLRPFRQEDAAFFFGRDEFVTRVAAAVTRHPVTAVAGASGSGKSSAIYAGLLPRLRQDPAENWTFLTLRPGREPFHAMAANMDALKRPLAPEVERLQETRALGDALRDGKVALREALLSLRPDDGRVLLFVDQWEELYTTCDDVVLRTRFIDRLLEAAGDRIAVLFTVRGDYFDDVLEHRALADRLHGAMVNIGPMTPEELRACIEGPAGRVGLSFEEGLVDAIITDVAGEAGSLPLLEFVLMELWERRRGDSMTVQAYAAIGGLRGAIADRAEDVLASFGPDSADVQLVKRVMLDLVSVAAGGETRRRATRAEIGEEAWRVVPALADARLLVTSHDDVTGEETAEVAHEALIRHWARLREWLDEDRAFLLWHQRLRNALQAWSAKPDDDGVLLRGSLLQEAARWRTSHGDRLPAREREFIEKSERRARLLRVRRVANAAFIALALVVLSLGAWRFQSIRERNLDMRAAAILEAAAQQRDPLLAALLIGEVEESREVPASARIARLIADRPIPLARIPAAGGRLLDLIVRDDGMVTVHADGRILQRTARGDIRAIATEGDPLRDARHDPTGRYLALVTQSNDVRLLDLQDGVDIRPWGGSAPANVALARFGAGQILTASHDGALTSWPLRGGANPVRFDAARGTPHNVLFDVSGNRVVLVTDSAVEWLPAAAGTAQQTLRMSGSGIATAAIALAGNVLILGSYDGAVRVWDPAAQNARIVRTGDGAPIWSVALDSAGRRYAFASENGLVCDGSVADPDAAPTCHTHDGAATLVAFSPDGRRIVSGGADAIAFTRAIASTSAIALSGHGDALARIEFDANGSRIVTASSDAEIRIWNASRTEPFTIGAPGLAAAAALAGDAGTVAMAGFDGAIRVHHVEDTTMFETTVPGSPSAIDVAGDRIAIAMSDGRVQVIHETEGGTISFDGHPTYVTSIAFDAAGDRLATTSADSTVRLWSVVNPADTRTLTGHADLVVGAVFNAEGDVLSHAEDGTARLWPAEGNGSPIVLRHSSPVRHAALSSTGEIIAAATQDGSIGIWSSDGDSLQSLRGHEAAVTFVTFDAQGQRVLSASADQTARVWSLDLSQQPVVLRGHRKHVRTARFDAAGLRIVTASLDSTARVFTLGEAGDAVTLQHGSALRDAAFTSDGSRVVTVGEDGSVLLWRVSWPALHAYLSATAACLSPDDRTLFLSEDPAEARNQAARCDARLAASTDGMR